MKIFAREFIWVIVALIFAAIIGFGFSYLMNLSPQDATATIEERVFEMEFFFIGAILGFVSAYIVRIIAWAITKQLLDN